MEEKYSMQERHSTKEKHFAKEKHSVKISDLVVLIPALNPDEKLIRQIQGLREEGFLRILVVDDGSTPESKEIFRKAQNLGCLLVHHEKNMGKGAAIKTAIRKAMAECGCPKGCITSDADGQHLPKDIRHVAEVMKAHPDSLVLGIRDFGLKNVPVRNRLGNRITSVFFRLTNGISCPDTQTGLRGIPPKLLHLALSEEGERYEYEMNFLIDAVHLVPVEYVPIETVYEDGNRVSHFRPVVDSCRVYGRFLKFAMSSLSGAAADYLLFCIFKQLLTVSQTQMIFIATALARIGSGVVNFLLNRYWSFRSRMPAGTEIFRYLVLFFCQMLLSAELVSLLALFSVPVIAAKVIVDTVLFFISFRIQKNWVFRQEVKTDAR
ncbi:MAG: glycosyltransferase [Lachnospiraceae bacterium]|nr:glycosyltransferase [Lachnospiraceae bacterium]